MKRARFIKELKYIFLHRKFVKLIFRVRISVLTLFHVNIGDNVYAERISCVKIPVYLGVDILQISYSA